jgi:hypothetical protein
MAGRRAMPITLVADAQLPFLKKSNSFRGILSNANFNYCSNFVLNKGALLPL